MKDIQLVYSYKDGNVTRRCTTGIFRDELDSNTRVMVLHQTARKNYSLDSFWSKKTLKQAYVTVTDINCTQEGRKFWMMVEGTHGPDLVSIMNDAVTEDSLTSLVFYDSKSNVLDILQNEYININITKI